MVNDISMDKNNEKEEEKLKKNKTKKIVLVITISFILVALLCVLIYFIVPRIYLNGKDHIKVEYGDTYNEPGFKAKYINKDVSKDVLIEGNVNIDKLGTYNIKYVIEKNNVKTKKIRVVEVVDTKKPEITLVGGESAIVCPNKAYEEQGYNAIDNYDGDITDKVQKEETDEKVLYYVSDSSGNKTEITRLITKDDKEKPKITLKNSSNYYIVKGTKYTDPGFTAIDNCDGDITTNVKKNGTVNTNTTGKYTVTYEVNDNAGNKVSVNRVVNVVNGITTTSEKKGTIYLTFDDGPSSSITPKLLDILKQKGVKATFFVINHSSNLDYLIKREYNEGHAVALHSYTHNYKTVYTSVDGYFNDLKKISDKVEKLTGNKSMIIRFPGGSSNTVSRKYKTGIMKTLTKEVVARGYHYFDWNVSSGDAGGAKTKNDIYKNVTKGLRKGRAIIVLIHDFENNYKTLNAISDIIDYGKKNGYEFLTIDMTTKMVKHPVNN